MSFKYCVIGRAHADSDMQDIIVVDSEFKEKTEIRFNNHIIYEMTEAAINVYEKHGNIMHNLFLFLKWGASETYVNNNIMRLIRDLKGNVPSFEKYQKDLEKYLILL